MNDNIILDVAESTGMFDAEKVIIARKIGLFITDDLAEKVNFDFCSSIIVALKDMISSYSPEELLNDNSVAAPGIYSIELSVKKLMKKVIWNVHSVSDPRWNKLGTCDADSVLNVVPMESWINECKKKFGEVPDDCTKEAWKD